MICSEKSCISEDHEGVIILDDDVSVGVPLADYMGDAVLEINILPNTARVANILGVAREVSRSPVSPCTSRKDFTSTSLWSGNYRRPRSRSPTPSSIRLCWDNSRRDHQTQPLLDVAPACWLGCVPSATSQTSPTTPCWKLRASLHAFDYDVLVQRAGENHPPSSPAPPRQTNA
jgi:hypothetical protein